MGVKLVSASGGSVELAAPATASNYTATMPANTGTVITTASTFAGTGPAFSAYQSTGQNVSTGTWAKVQFQTEEFDTANCFDSTTNYRFTPNVAGYYLIATDVGYSTTITTECIVSLWKNGSEYRRLSDVLSTFSVNGSCLVYLNGSTDYIEIYAYQASGSTKTTDNRSFSTWVNGFLARAA